jgi:hypothetical protein
MGFLLESSGTTINDFRPLELHDLGYLRMYTFTYSQFLIINFPTFYTAINNASSKSLSGIQRKSTIYMF